MISHENEVPEEQSRINEEEMLTHFSDCPVNLSEHFSRNGLREVNARHLCTKSRRKLLNLDMVEFGISSMRHN